MTDRTAPDQIKNLEDQLNRHIARITDAIDDARSDRVQDMTRLDGEVALLCRDLGRLPPAQATTLAAPVAEMIGRLEELIRELQAFRERAMQENRTP